jgi:urease accessory protein
MSSPADSMLTLHTKITDETITAETIAGELVLPYDLREKSRLRAELASGEEVAVFTVRGTVLRDGDLLRGSDGRVVRIRAAPEASYRIECRSEKDLLRCAFHLGNRHTQAQVGGDAAAPFLRIRRDPVLKEMLMGLGANVIEEQAPFEPESGAYGGGYSHDHDHHPLAPVPVRQKIHRPSDRE